MDEKGEARPRPPLLAPFLRESLGAVGVVAGGFLGAYGVFSSLIGPVSAVIPKRPFLQVGLTAVPSVLSAVMLAGAAQSALPGAAEVVLAAAGAKPSNSGKHVVGLRLQQQQLQQQQQQQEGSWTSAGADSEEGVAIGHTPLSHLAGISPFRKPLSKDMHTIFAVAGSTSLGAASYFALRKATYRMGKTAERRIGRGGLAFAVMSSTYLGAFVGPTLGDAVFDLFYLSTSLTDIAMKEVVNTMRKD
mmetsp:Transcript_37396/g.96636  ORF Transcript_37396/g.96636 Transcript_37396/m.96636 type:complete len:246 (-) Transcript_37396:47-784(-)|eukprot:CAMPEP_0113889704 /NCGR_PEP_ID=MMETSP0780_2-20120614/13670_1 /TAXON_ID=652834 /ORGANISM="Palpitomonas bilix" /LENGTH=245 /DNA_ID=CAMNT_0000878883 /DNA_START=312 /DNA_END=1049 /DNA_ORIENTATION=- /assembly_acc=CAM_ASM_000599